MRETARTHATRAQVGDVVQIAPTPDGVFGGCFLTVTEPKGWGVVGYVAIPRRGRAYYRVPWAQLVVVGRAAWATPSDEDDREGA